MIRTLQRSYSGFLEVVGIPVLHFGYVMTTDRDKHIMVSRKYISNPGGICMNHMIVDAYGIHYHMNNCVWHPKWPYIEHWNQIREGDTLHIQCYGYRNSMLGIYPNIVNIGRPDTQKIWGKDVNIML